MTTTDEQAKFSLDDLIKMADEIKAKHLADYPDFPAMAPFDLLTAMSARILAAYIPEHSKTLLDRQHGNAEQSFAFDILGANNLPASLWISAERQTELYGGIEPMLFEKLPEGIFDHYRRLLGRNPGHDDPLTWECTEVGG